MDRHREARRGTTAAMNGGLSRRRQRSSGSRDSPEEDGGMELQESARLRERGSKKDRDRDKFSRSKRRRGDRMLHGSNREEGEDSSEESVDEEEEDEDDDAVAAAVRLPPPPPANPSPSSSSLPPNHHSRKTFPARLVRAPAVWKVADEMIGVSVPRKARTALVKRSHECWVSDGGSGGGGGGVGTAEQIHRQASTSPARPSPATTAPISPSSSNASVRKKMKPISGTKHRPPKIGKSSSSIQEIEIEVAEVLYGLTRQFKQEIHKPDSKDLNGSSNEGKSRVSSPNSISPPPPASQSSVLPALNSSSSGAPLPIVAPKRKRPRPVKFEDERPTNLPNLLAVSSTSILSTSKINVEQPTKVEFPSPKSENNMSSAAPENGGVPLDLGQIVGTPPDVQQVSARAESNTISDLKPLVAECLDQIEAKEKVALVSKEPSQVELDVNLDETTLTKAATAAESPHVEKCRIDLMAPPPGKSSPEREGLPDFSMDQKPSKSEIEMGPKVETVKIEEERVESTAKQEAVELFREEKKVEKTMSGVFELKKHMGKERTLDVKLDIENQDKDGLVSNQLGQKQQSKSTRTEMRPEKPGASLPFPMTVAGWPGGLPPFRYNMGQLPSLQAVDPVDGSTGSSKTLQLRLKRCATHCYIAKNICYHQQLARMNTFWPAAAGTTPIYGAKPYNLNVMPPESANLSNPLQGGFRGRSLGSLQDKGGPVVSNFSGHSSKDKNSVASTYIDTPQRKQLVMQQGPQAGSTSNMLHAPAFIFPLNQQQGAAASTRSGAVKSTTGFGNVPPSSNAPNSAVVSSGSAAAPAPTVSFNYANLPSEAQYLAILQNNAYPFPIPAHVGAPLPYRGGSHAQLPFFNGPFYTSQMLHPSQLQQQPQSQQPPSTQQGHQNTSTSSGSSSSQKHPQQPQRVKGGGASGTGGTPLGFPASKQRAPPHHARQLECETGGEDSPSTADSRVSQAQKGIYSHNFAMPMHPQNFALMSPAAALASAGNHSEKHHPSSPQQQQQSMKVELTPSQAFAMSFASFNGAGAPAPPGLDFSSLAQNHALFQSLPEAARHGYQIAAAAAAAAAQVAQHKKTHHQIRDDGKTIVDSMNPSVSSEEEKMMISAGKPLGGISQHSLAFSRPDCDSPKSTILGNSVIDSSARTLNLIPGPVNGTRASNRSANGTPMSTAATAAKNASNSQHQQQQQIIQLQKQQQQQQQLQQQQQQQLQQQQQQQLQHQQLQMQHQFASRSKSAASSNNAGVYSDRLPPGPMVTKFPNALSGFPQAAGIQGSSPTQSSQWKNSARVATSVSSSSPTPNQSVKSHHPQQLGRSTQPTLSSPGHHAHISFGVNSLKAASTGQQLSGGNNNPSSPSAAGVVGSPPTSAQKSTGGSPRASAGSTPGPQTTTLPLQQQQSQPPPSKNSPSSSSRKSSPVSNRTVPSGLGPPHIAPAPSSSTKLQHQLQQQLHQQQQQQQHQQQQQLQKQAFSQAQLFFSNPYMQAQSPQSAAAAAGYYQRRPSEQQQSTQHQPPNSTSGTSGMLSLCSPALTLAGGGTTSDPAKAVAAAAAAANGMKGLPPAGLLHAQFVAAAAQSGGGPHPLGFPYIPGMPSVSVKPAEQKPAAGNDNLHACWQPEKR